MSTQCRHFVQNAWKKELCSNCFKSREEHASVQEQIRPIVARTANTVKRVAHKVQGILRLKESHAQVRSKRKSVAFPESLAEIIGYDGGDESAGSDEEQTHDEPDELSASFDVDDLPDSEEERALGNLTRANTNFNTVTANLSAGPVEAKPQAKSFNTLMLGRAQKDSDGKKKTLLVTVTPFGADDTLPTARRPSDKKSPEVSKPKPSLIDNSESAKTNSELSPLVKSVAPKKSSDDKPTETSQAKTSSAASSLGKIVDMPLITSTNLMSVMRDDLTPVSAVSVDKSTEQKRTTSIARTPAIKKPENEKPRIVAQQASSDQNAARNHKNLEMSNGVELNLSPIRSEVNAESSSFGKEIPKFKADYSRESSKARANLADLTERKVEGEAAVSISSSSEKYPFEESRESAGEPDGKADEEVVAEPPALPKSPPPIEAPFSSDKRSLSSSAEPRASFLHGTSEASKTTKPAVPQKPLTLPPAKFIGSSLASLLSENRAYEYRLSQSQRNSAGGLMHSQSESQLCAVDDEPGKRNSAPGVQTKISADSCSQLNQTEHLYKATCVKTVEKDDQTEEEIEAEEDEDSEASSTDQPRSSSKRRMAPQPPSCSDESATSLFARNPASLSSGLAAKSTDCPVVREKEKRERASSCSPKFRKTVSDAPDPCAVRPPEPAPRRNISLSQDSLAPAACSERVVEEKKKARSKFSLKKFLRMGTRKDVDMTGASGTRNDEIPSTPQPKPRLEIIHPLELDGAAVQVLRNDKSTSEDTTDSRSENQSNSNQSVPAAQHITTRPSKPPPPPRAQSLEESSKSRISAPKLQQTSSSNGNSGSGKPLVGKSWQPSGGSSASDSIYANLGPAAAEDVAGAIRSALAPAKPRRTSSMRDQQQQQQQQQQQPTASPQPASPSRTVPAGSVGVVVGQQRHCALMLERQRSHTPLESPVSSDSQGYECLSSSLDNSSSSELELRGHQGSVNHPITKRQSDSSALESTSSELKFQQSLFTRSTSLPYCASESESELYSPFSYYHGDEISEEGQDRKDEESRIGRLRQRRGRSIVHRSLEDNYGAVIVANHEALAQFLEQMNQAPAIAAGLRGLKSATNLQFRDFSVEKSTALVWGRRIFFSASWNEQSVTLCVAFDRPSMHVSRREFYLAPILEFIDTVPKDVAEMLARKNYEATISVLPRLQVNTIKSFAESMSKPASGMKEEHAIRESSFVLLQLVSALKSLQARAIEEAPADLTNIVLCREDKDAYHRLYLFQGLNIDSENNEEECGSLCQCALNALEELNLAKKLPLIRELLMREKAVTLSQVKSVLEFSLWGPADATLGGPRERELALQRWLDLERATVLQALVRARAQLTVTDEYQLLFLVRTSAKIMCEASLLLDRQRSGLLLPRATLDR